MRRCNITVPQPPQIHIFFVLFFFFPDVGNLLNFFFIGSCYVRPPDNGIKNGDVEAKEDNSPNDIVDLFDDLSRG